MKLIEIIKDLNLNLNLEQNGYSIGGTDKNTSHSYIEKFYEIEFFKYKDRKINLLEIGIQTGGSLKLWKEYFLNSQSIVGVDISDDCVDSKYKNLPGIDMYFFDAYDKKLSKDLKNFDIIIDDGPHTLESQLKCIELYLPKLNKDGLLVIEDIQSHSHFDTLVNKFKEVTAYIGTGYNYTFECVDLRQEKNRYDDLIFSIKS